MKFNLLPLILLFLLTRPRAQEIYFDKPIGAVVTAKKAFWKKIYAEIDSSLTVIYDKTNLHTYAVVKNGAAGATVDSLKKATGESAAFSMVTHSGS
jgi:hypothetical protein